MTPRLSITWQRVIRWGVRVVAAVGVIVSFIALDPLIAGPIALSILGLNIFLERIHFFARVLHVTPMPSEYVIRDKLGSLWALESYKGEETILFGQLFRTRRAAKEAYQLFRAWNLGDYIDRNGNIVLSIVREELDRYTILLYPGERGVTEHGKHMVAETYGDKTEAIVSKIVFWFITHADYLRRPTVKSTLERLPGCSKVLLNCYFMRDGEPQSVARRHLELAEAVIVDRSAVASGSLESCFQWEDPWTGMDRETREKYEPDFQAVNERGNSNAI